MFHSRMGSNMEGPYFGLVSLVGYILVISDLAEKVPKREELRSPDLYTASSALRGELGTL